MKKVRPADVGITFLHAHSGAENLPGDHDHVIVDRNDWELAVNFLRSLRNSHIEFEAMPEDLVGVVEAAKKKLDNSATKIESVNLNVKSDRIADVKVEWVDQPLPDIQLTAAKSSECVLDKTEFSKSDLRTGMRVTIRDGRRFIVMLNTSCEDGIYSFGINYIRLKQYNEDLTFGCRGDLAIVVVERPASGTAMLNEKGHLHPVWRRDQPKYLSIKEVAALYEQEVSYELLSECGCDWEPLTGIVTHNLLRAMHIKTVKNVLKIEKT